MENILIFKNNDFSLTKSNDGFWLYDYEHEQNISIRASSELDAMKEALLWYKERLLKKIARIE